jgi:hypothetical protein
MTAIWDPGAGLDYAPSFAVQRSLITDSLNKVHLSEMPTIRPCEMRYHHRAHSDLAANEDHRIDSRGCQEDD